MSFEVLIPVNMKIRVSELDTVYFGRLHARISENMLFPSLSKAEDEPVVTIFCPEKAVGSFEVCADPSDWAVTAL